MESPRGYLDDERSAAVGQEASVWRVVRMPLLVLVLSVAALTTFLPAATEPPEAEAEKAQQVAAARPSPAPAVRQHAAPEAPRRSMIVHAGRGGHFFLDLYVNGVKLHFLVDTGATTVALSPADARRARVHPNRLEYTDRYHTANGVIYAAPVLLREIRLNDLRLRDVEASVTDSDMSISLLGMSFLSRLRGYEVKGDKLFLRW